jgi:DNA-directed RNA polymerase alpha subunit
MKYLDKKIDILELDKNIINLLINNGINNISDLYVLNRKKIKEFGLSDSNINKISIKLQLLGLDLNGKKY